MVRHEIHLFIVAQKFNLLLPTILNAVTINTVVVQIPGRFVPWSTRLVVGGGGGIQPEMR